MELLVLDVNRLARVVARPEDNRPASREYQRILAEMFTEAGDPMDPVAVERWRQRGAIPTTRLLMLLQFAKERGIKIDLLKFALPAERIERAEGARPSKGRSSMRFDNTVPSAVRRPSARHSGGL
jgi:hypothetical protein